MFDESWDTFRETCLREIKNREESAIKRWLQEIKYSGTIGYFRNIATHTLEIYTTHPGILIGKAGCNVPSIQQILQEEFGGKEWNIRFVEIQGGFVSNI